ncbi:MAG: HD family phosphohydrolase [Ruminococcaceae bacterium]|nr:HD family phosphohydrolase [Oscillospiraceae bacterium]
MELTFRGVPDDVMVPDDAEYLAIVEDILQDEDVQSMKTFIQHGTTSCLEHSIAVSYLSYKTCLKYGLDARAAARAGLLHDLFLYDWHLHSSITGGKMHAFTHPGSALKNAERKFHLSKKEREIILKHMWPLTVIPPRHPESYVVLFHDKACSMRETFRRPVPNLNMA